MADELDDDFAWDDDSDHHKRIYFHRQTAGDTYYYTTRELLRFSVPGLIVDLNCKQKQYINYMYAAGPFIAVALFALSNITISPKSKTIINAMT